MRRLLTVAVAAGLVCTVAAALRAQGEFPLKYQDAQEGDPLGMMGSVPVQMLPEKPAELKAVPKDLPDKAMYFTISIGGKKTPGVLDASGAKLFIDTAGTGDLSGAQPLAAAKTQEGQAQSFGPVTFSLPGAKGPVTVRARLILYGGRMLMAVPAGHVTGEVKLDGQAYKVAVVDSNLDGRYDKTLPLPISRSSPPSFDAFAIDLDQNGRFDQASFETSEVLPLFPMVQVKGAVYSIKVEPDGSRVKLEKVEQKTGTLETGQPDGSLVLVGDIGVRRLTGSDGKYPLPAGKYSAVAAQVTKADKEGVKWTLSASGEMGTMEALEIRAGETLKVKLGPPVAAKTSAAKGADGVISIGYVLEGQAGEQYGAAQKEGARPPPPKLKILDEKGAVLAQGNFEYG